MGHISEGHPEATVIFGCEASFLFELICPKFGLITPGAFPFEFTPRISEFNELDGVAIRIVVFQDGDQPI